MDYKLQDEKISKLKSNAIRIIHTWKIITHEIGNIWQRGELFRLIQRLISMYNVWAMYNASNLNFLHFKEYWVSETKIELTECYLMDTKLMIWTSRRLFELLNVLLAPCTCRGVHLSSLSLLTQPSILICLLP